jgi:alpha-D-xyloside xylohydrolase
MKQNNDWQTIACPLDVRNIFAPRHYIRSWRTYRRTDQGLIFSCKLANGDPLDYHVDVIEPDVVRMRMNPHGLRHAASDMLVKDAFPACEFELIESDDCLILATGRIRIEFPRLWQITAYDDPRPGHGHPFYTQSTEDRAYGPGFETPPSGFDVTEAGEYCIRESVAVSPGESFYGLGEKFTSLDKWNQEVAIWTVDSGNVSSNRSYKNVPLLLSSAGYALFVHSSYPMVFRMGSQSTIAYSIHVYDCQLDLFLIYGPSLKHLLKRYSELTGFAPLPPKWSFGFWISRAGYRNQKDVEGVVSEMRRRGFPCDVLSLDPWWMGAGPWSTYEWDETQFPNPAEMMGWMRENGVRTCLWIHPYVPVESPLFAEGQASGYFIKDQNGEVSSVLEAFSGDGEGLAAVDFTNPAACAWWQSKLERLHDMGVAVFKTDFGEQAPLDAVYHDGRSGLEMHNLYPLIYNRTAFELSRRKFGRGLVWGRAAYAGSQRYPVQWGGDSYSTLDQLACQVRAMLGYGLSGVPFSSHDVGGFDFSPHFFDDVFHVDFNESYTEAIQSTYPKDEVVYARWLQVGVFSSHIRAHGKQPREPWTFGETVEKIALKYLNLRYRLLPYIYTQAVNSARTGLPLVRPMVLEFQDDPTTQRLDLQYMFGDSFLVAPVLTRHAELKVYLPHGLWIDYWTKEVIVGSQWVILAAPLDTLPLWVRGGSILPLGPEMDFVDQKPLDPLTIEIYAPQGQASFTIEDEDRPAIEVSYRRTDLHLAVDLGPTTGQVNLLLYGVRLHAAWIDDEPLLIQPIPGGCAVTLDGRRGCLLAFELEASNPSEVDPYKDGRDG